VFSIGDRVIYKSSLLNFNLRLWFDLPPDKAIILNKSRSKCEFYGNDDYYKIKIIDDGFYCVQVVNVKDLTIDNEFYKSEKREELIKEILK